MFPDRTTREMLLLKQHYNVPDDDPIFLFLEGYGKLQERMHHNIVGARSLATKLSATWRMADEKTEKFIAATENLAKLGETLNDTEAFYFKHQNKANEILSKQENILEQLENFDTSLMQLVIKHQMEEIGQGLVMQMDRALRRRQYQNESLKRKVVKVATVSSGLTAIVIASLMLAILR